MSSFTFIELFAGVGGFRVGLEAIGGKLVWGCDIDHDSQVTYRANFGQDQTLYADITQAKSQFIPQHDILTAGFPCQDFSTLGAGHRDGQKGLEGDTGSLFFEVVRLLKECQPKCFLLENVHGLQKMKDGETIRQVVLALESAGYTVKYTSMNSNCLLPQFRRRIYLVGFLDAGAAARFQFPAPPEITPRRIVGDALDLTDPFLPTYKLSKRQWRTVKDSKPSKKYGIETRLLRPSSKEADTLLKSYKGSRNSMSQFVMEDNLEDAVRDCNGSEGRPRWLTVRECARLMGFPNSFQFPPGPCAYKLLGNAVTPPLIALLGASLRAALENDDKYLLAGLGSAFQLTLASTSPARQEFLLNSVVDHPAFGGTVKELIELVFGPLEEQEKKEMKEKEEEKEEKDEEKDEEKEEKEEHRRIPVCIQALHPGEVLLNRKMIGLFSVGLVCWSLYQGQTKK